MIIAGIVIAVIVLVGGIVGSTAYLSAQRQAEEARIAKEKAETEKKELQRKAEEAEKKAAEEKRLKEEAEERERQEKAARQEKERLELEEETENLKEQETANAKKALGQVSDITQKAEVKWVNGEFDAGFTVSGSVKNAGLGGDLKVVAFLSCSEGEWLRTQHLYFRQGQTMNLTYFFHEPTVNASSCQARIVKAPI